MLSSSDDDNQIKTVIIMYRYIQSHTDVLRNMLRVYIKKFDYLTTNHSTALNSGKVTQLFLSRMAAAAGILVPGIWGFVSAAVMISLLAVTRMAPA